MCSIDILKCEIVGVDDFRSFDVVTTVRSAEKGDKILAAHPNTPKEKLSYVIVKDIAQDGAFDEVASTFWSLVD